MPFTDLRVIRVTGTYLLFDGSFASGQVQFDAPASLKGLQDALGNQIIVPESITVQLDGVGHIAVNLPASNDPLVTPTGFTYHVTETIHNTAHTPREYDVVIPYDAPSLTIDLADLVPVAPLDAFGTFASQADLLALALRVTALEGGVAGGDLSPVFSKAGIIQGGPLHGGWPAPAPFTIHSVIALLTTAPGGQPAIFDIQKNGTSIFNAGSRRPTIQPATKLFETAALVSTGPNADNIVVATHDILTASVIQPGTPGNEGLDLTLLVVKA